MKGQYITKLSDANIAKYAIDHRERLPNSTAQESTPTKDTVNNIITVYGTNLKIDTNIQ